MTGRQAGIQTVVAEALRVQRSDGQHEHGRRMNSNGQVNRRLGVRLGCVHPAARHIQHVTGFQVHIRWRRKAFEDNGFVLVALDLAWRQVRPHVEMPRLGALNLQDQDVVVIVVPDEPAGLRWRDVGVHPRREVQLHLERSGQCPDRPRVLLDAVDDDGVAVDKVITDARDIESAIGQPVIVRAFLVFSAYQPQR
jgi:hypothetical protein